MLALFGVPLVVIDIEVHRLPDRLTGPAALAGAVLLTVAAAVDGSWHPLLRALEGAVAALVVFGAFFAVSARSFGLGDVKLAGVLGGYLAWFGWAYLFYGIFLGFVLGAVVGIVLLVSGRAGRRTPIPFGPMLLLGALTVIALRLVRASA